MSCTGSDGSGEPATLPLEPTYIEASRRFWVLRPFLPLSFAPSPSTVLLGADQILRPSEEGGLDSDAPMLEGVKVCFPYGGCGRRATLPSRGATRTPTTA